jgi:uncharacterized protein
MSEPALIDALKFAREQRRLEGELDVARMPRLQDIVYEQAGSVRYSLAGMLDARGRPTIAASVHGMIPLVCQRCLERLDYALDRRSRLVLVADEGQLPDVAEEDPEIEAIAAVEAANVADLIEQEVLLGLPLAPVHEPPCNPGPAPEEEKIESPFAVLRTLKQDQT